MSPSFFSLIAIEDTSTQAFYGSGQINIFKQIKLS